MQPLRLIIDGSGISIFTMNFQFTLNFIRPIYITIALCLIYNFRTVIHKLKLTLQGITYFLLSKDKTYNAPNPYPSFEGITKIEKKTIIFVRHGESTWNDTFNKGHRSLLLFSVGFIPGLLYAVLYEFYLVLAGKMDSWFYDSPLSHLGLEQVDKLALFLQESEQKVSGDEAKLLAIMNADPSAPPSILVSSSLRRAISTIAASFRVRLSKNPSDSILILPSLQEISRNPDTLSITPAYTSVTPSWIDQESKVCDFHKIFEEHLDVKWNKGNKPMDTNGYKRMSAFCQDVFSDKIKEEYVIVGGHSIWFRSFFRAFLPHDFAHVSKKNKVVNAGCVSFTLMKTSTGDGDKFMIDKDSIKVLYGGF